MTTFTYSNVSADVLSQMLDKLKASGSTVTPEVPNYWTIEGSGIKASVTYQPEKRSAFVIIIAKPFYVPEWMIDGQIREALGRANNGGQK